MQRTKEFSLLNNILIILIAIFLNISNSNAATSFASVGPKIGSQGIGLEMKFPLSNSLFTRISINYLSLKKKYNSQSINYRGNVILCSIPATLDWHFLENSGFKLSLGIAYNCNRFQGLSDTINFILINGKIINTNQYLGQLYKNPLDLAQNQPKITKAKIKLDVGGNIGIIASVGYDSAFLNNENLNINCELGLMYSHSNKLTVSYNNSHAVKKWIEQDAHKAFREFKKLAKFWPIISVGIRYTF